MIGGGVVAALLACQMASEAYRESGYNTPSYTMPNSTFTRASETATINSFQTAMPNTFSTGSL